MRVRHALPPLIRLLCLPATYRAWISLLATTLLSIGLAGCINKPLGTDAQFDSRSAKGSGLVVFGIRVVGEPKGHGLLFGDYNLNPVYELQFDAVDATGHLAAPETIVQICGGERLILRGAFSDCEPSRMEYKVFEVPAGRYVLADFRFRAEREVIETNFIGTDANNPATSGFALGMGNAPKRGQALRYPGRSFAVGAGEIVTIGDMTLDSSGVPVRISMQRNDAASAAALRSYREITGPVVFRPVFGN